MVVEANERSVADVAAPVAAHAVPSAVIATSAAIAPEQSAVAYTWKSYAAVAPEALLATIFVEYPALCMQTSEYIAANPASAPAPHTSLL